MIVVHVARKPITEPNVAANVLAHGAGALNINACRIATTDDVLATALARDKHSRHDDTENWRFRKQGNYEYQPTSGRWPANLILGHLDGCVQDGTRTIRPLEGHRPNPVAVQSDGNIQFNQKKPGFQKVSYTNDEGVETIPAWICVPGCPVASVDAQSGDRPVSGAARTGRTAQTHDPLGVTYFTDKGSGATHDDAGGASRYFKQVGGHKP